MRAVSAEARIDAKYFQIHRAFLLFKSCFKNSLKFFVVLGWKLGLSGLPNKYSPSVSGKDESNPFCV